MTGSASITTRDLTRNYDTLTALDQVSLDIHQGECVALVGPNGAGKSTLFKLCLGLLSASAGTINVLGCNPETAAFGAMKRRIGFLPEQVMFQGSLTGHETLRFYARLKRADPSHNERILDRVQLSQAAGRRVSTYSKGMRQRLGLAQALIGQPNILLLDEPMSGLDPEARQNFFRILDEEKSAGAAIVLSSHILTELEARTDRIAILNEGKLKAIGPIAQLRSELQLNARIRLRAGNRQMQQLARHFSGRFDPACFKNGTAVLDCPVEDKLMLLKELMGSDLAFENLDIVEPSLEQIFTAHTAEGKPS
jgi:Cu-processing system ATP-binding protein